MIWSPVDEMKRAVNKVTDLTRILKQIHHQEVVHIYNDIEEDVINAKNPEELPIHAPGSIRDSKRYASYLVDVSDESPFSKPPSSGNRLVYPDETNVNIANKESKRSNVDTSTQVNRQSYCYESRVDAPKVEHQQSKKPRIIVVLDDSDDEQ